MPRCLPTCGCTCGPTVADQPATGSATQESSGSQPVSTSRCPAVSAKTLRSCGVHEAQRGFCLRLERRLAKLGVPLDHRNIWDEPAAVARVRIEAPEASVA